MRVPTLETPRLILRPMTVADAPAVQAGFDNWNVVKQIGGGVPWPYPSDGASTHLHAVLDDAEATGTYLWALVLERSTDDAVGAIEYRLSPDADDNRGFWLRESLWKRGLMTEAVIATQDFVFADLDVDRIVMMNAVSNVGSIRIKERCGARRIGRVPESYLSGDDFRDVWEVTRETWMSTRDDASLDRYRL